MNSAPGSAEAITADCTAEADCERLVSETVDRLDRLDILVNNAGIPGPLVPIDQLDDAAWQRVIAVDLGGVFLCTKYAVPALVASGRGAIVNIASTFGMIGAPHTPAYAASKGGVIALTRQLAVDLGPRGVTGKDAQEALDRAWITVNKNTIPFETRSPMVTSGIRVGTPAVTTRGMKEPEMEAIAGFIDRVLRARGDQKAEASVRVDVASLAGRFPLYPERLA